ncbi:MAG TPA: vitamin K epoxide reductase family protein [Candidatus Binatus sp.]|nr:vitamin K epoxide reductase family protein [Candidatus Binatus sp.]
MERFAVVFLVVSAIGIGVASYTAYEYVTQDFASCSISQQFSCAGVFQSGVTSIFGIQFYVLGLAWSTLLFALGILTTRIAQTSLNIEVLLPLLMIGNIFTVYLWYLELAVIHVICPLCVANYVVNYALTIIVIVRFLRESGAEST